MELLFKDLYEPSDLRNNRLHLSDKAFHGWYRFVLSFPPHLVREYLNRFSLSQGHTLLDPFCGTGTTLVEAKRNSVASVGIEASPMAAFASRVKTTWIKEFDLLRQTADALSRDASRRYLKCKETILELSPDQEKLITRNAISQTPLQKCLILLDEIRMIKDCKIRDALLLALAHVIVFSASNLKFGPEVGVSRNKKEDAPVFEDFLKKTCAMARDLESVSDLTVPQSTVIAADARDIGSLIPQASVDAVITSPPYPNEKDYTRTTRLESVILGFIKDKKHLRELKQGLLRSNTRNVYVKDDDDKLIPPGSAIDRIAKEIERRRVALGKTSGFERLYHRVTRLYFGGMKKHFIQLQRILRPGAKLAYVVGDQASYLQVMIRTGELLADLAHEVGYNVLGLELFRTRVSTTTGEHLREEVLVLEWKGTKKGITVKKIKNRYDQLIEKVFFNNYSEGDSEVTFDREEFESTAKELGIAAPKNLGDIVYSYRYRNELPPSINALLKKGQAWLIRSAGRGRYKFAISTSQKIVPNPRLSRIKILDATPEIIRRYALNDEQALLAILRYNRLIDIFLGITCYPLQSHLRTTVPDMGQVETDEIYVGLSKQGTQYVVPVQVKGKKEELGIVQMEQDFAMCHSKFPDLVCRPVAAQLMENDLVALFELEEDQDEMRIKEEKHYCLVSNEDLSDSEIAKYKKDANR